jgi:acyl-CoA thioester hydrolase
MPNHFSISHRVQFSETDQAGVVHFSNYFRWMEEVEHAFFRSLGLSVSMDHEGIEIGWPRVSASCEYLAPARFEDEVELRLWVTKIGQSSFNYEVEFLCHEKRIARGRISSVCCRLGPGGMESMPIPGDLRARLGERS